MTMRPFDPQMILSSIPVILPFLLVTISVGFISILLGSILGAGIAGAALSRIRLLRGMASSYVYTIRCTPSIVLLFVVFYGLPKLTEYLLGWNMDGVSRAVFVIITFALLFGGYVSEVFRSAYLAVGREPYEAAVSVGLSPHQAFFHIVLPLAAAAALPNFGNSVIGLLKESALAYTIGLIDLIGEGNLLIARNYGAYSIEIYLSCMLVYWIMNLCIEKTFLFLEMHLSRRDRMGIE